MTEHHSALHLDLCALAESSLAPPSPPSPDDPTLLMTFDPQLEAQFSAQTLGSVVDYNHAMDLTQPCAPSCARASPPSNAPAPAPAPDWSYCCQLARYFYNQGAPLPSLTALTLLRGLHTTCGTALTETSPAAGARLGVFGDLHGHFRDLLRGLEVAGVNLNDENGFPDDLTLIFVGDYVDRGPMGTEIVLLLCALKLAYPDRVHLIRGNHECRPIFTAYGFADEVRTKYPAALLEVFAEVFRALPLALVAGGKLMVVHAAPPVRASAGVDVLRSLRHRVDVFAEGSVGEELLWSDPDETLDGYRAVSDVIFEHLYAGGRVETPETESPRLGRLLSWLRRVVRRRAQEAQGMRGGQGAGQDAGQVLEVEDDEDDEDDVEIDIDSCNEPSPAPAPSSPITPATPSSADCYYDADCYCDDFDNEKDELRPASLSYSAILSGGSPWSGSVTGDGSDDGDNDDDDETEEDNDDDEYADTVDSMDEQPRAFGAADLVRLRPLGPAGSDVPRVAPSNRGAGYTFSYECVRRWLTANGLTHCIRGHQAQQRGWARHWMSHADRDGLEFWTVFSASNYNQMGNDGAILMVYWGAEDDIRLEPQCWAPLEPLVATGLAGLAAALAD